MIENSIAEFKSLLTNPGLFIDRKIGILTHVDKTFGKDYLANDLYKTYTEFVLDLPNLYKQHFGFKITGLETYNNAIKERCGWLSDIWKEQEITAHGYLGFSQGASFDWHSDDCNVYLFVTYGSKIVHFRDRTCTLTNGHGIFIPKGVEHRIVNETDCVAISFGHL